MDKPDTIKIGDYVIIQRQKYTKLHKFSGLDVTAILGKDQLALKNINGHPYFTTFKMVPKEGRNKKLCSLEPCSDINDLKDIITNKEKGVDNRNILDDGLSQKLTPDEIDKLRETCSSSTEIVERLIENSSTFNAKTEYSQEKYLKKKEKKYFEYVQIRRPTIRLISDIFYRQDPDKIMGMRMDTLSQLISYSGICCNGNYLLYESGTNGLLPAALLNSIGAKTEGKLIHMHPGNVPQKQALLALNFDQEQLDRCISVNIYSVLRQFYQGEQEIKDNSVDKIDEVENGVSTKKRKLSSGEENSPPIKHLKTTTGNDEGASPVITKHEAVKQKWIVDNENACKLMNEKLDGLIIVAKEHPSNIIKGLLPFIKPSRPVVVFGLSRELLMECYVELKTASEVTGLRLTSNWLRMYQILPNRTHPHVNMNANGGYLLTGYTVKK